MKLPLFNSSQMVTLEQYASDTFNISINDMMLCAGNSIAEMVMDVCIKDGKESSHVLVVAGRGNNGGDAIVAARILKEKGVDVTILAPWPNFGDTALAAQQMTAAQDSGVPFVFDLEGLAKTDTKYTLIIDGLFGFALEGDPRPPASDIIDWMNGAHLPIVSIDVPSGLDVNTGRLMKPAVKATHTLALGLPKLGMDVYRENAGKLYLGSLGIPMRAYEKVGITQPIFQGKSYVPLH